MMKNTKKGRRNPRRALREADIDFGGIAEELAKEKPKMIMVSDALERLVEELSKGKERGLMVEQIATICSRHGLDVDEEEISEVLDRKGEEVTGE